MTSELLLGEWFEARSAQQSWLGGTCAHDGYAGFVVSADFKLEDVPATHHVTVREALLFSEPSIKAAVLSRLSMGSWLVAESRNPIQMTGRAGSDDMCEPFIKLSNGYVHTRHVAPLHEGQRRDTVAWAQPLVGTPYLWGGRSATGIDCSGFVQLALGMTGVAVPRDTGDQRDAIGNPISIDLIARGDLVFMPGHVVLMVDPVRAIHANAHWMTVTIEPLADILARLPKSSEITARRL